MSPSDWTPADLSDAERCPRIPQLRRLPADLAQLPMREAVELRLMEGIRAIYLGNVNDGRELAVDNFLQAAVAPGYLYPDLGDAYDVVNDHASWLDGALRLVTEYCGEPASALPVLMLDSHALATDAWVTTAGVAHLYRVVAHKLAPPPPEPGEEREVIPEPNVRWPELVASLDPAIQSVRVIRLRLPALRGPRLMSPLVVAYEHPATGQLRLQRLTQESPDSTRKNRNTKFSSYWKHVGRWERPDIEWEEWREGIDRDECLAQILDLHAYQVADNRAGVRRDALALLNRASLPLARLPRLRETCNHCEFKGVCHDGRSTTNPTITADRASAGQACGVAAVS